MGDQRWRTPAWLFGLLEREVVGRKFKLDAAASSENALCRKYYTEANSGLENPWLDPTWCNPGFADFGAWIDKAEREARERKIVACLVGPTGCSQKWFHEIAQRGRIYAPDRRISFCGSTTGAPSRGADRDSMIYLFGPGFWNPDLTVFGIRPLNVRSSVRHY